jgi:hypothetical protein
VVFAATVIVAGSNAMPWMKASFVPGPVPFVPGVVVGVIESVYLLQLFKMLRIAKRMGIPINNLLFEPINFFIDLVYVYLD